MQPQPKPVKPGRSQADLILIGVFWLLLWAPSLDTVFRVDHSRQPGENRLPAQFPIWDHVHPAAVQRYLTGLDNYFADHFGFRNKLIRWFQNLKISLFHDRSVYNVIAGQHGWLFSSDLKMIEHYLGIARFTSGELEQWQSLLEKRRDWLAKQGIEYLFVIPPDKQSIYPEELPQWLLNATPTNRSCKLDQFLQHMAKNSTIRILDLRPPLLDAKNVRPTYLKNDSHWNLYGGFIACQELIKVLSRPFADLPPLLISDFAWSNAPATGGDLARILGSEFPDQNLFQVTPGNGLVPLATVLATNIDSVWDQHRMVVITENPSPRARSAMVFNDSYGDALHPFLGYSFKRVVYVHDNREFNPSAILANKPDVVISEMLQRYFNTLSPVELLAKEPLP